MADSKTKKAITDLPSTTPTAAPANTPALPTGTRTYNAAQGQLNGAVADDVIAHDAAGLQGAVTYDTDPVARRTSSMVQATYGQGLSRDPQGGFSGPAHQVVGSSTSTVAAERAKLYQLNRGDLTALQGQLARAGFYGNADKDGHFNYTPGVRDDKTVEAYNSWLITSAREYKATRQTADDVLDHMGSEHDRSGDLLSATQKAKTGGPGSERVVQIDLMDPHQLSQMGDQFGQAILGRALTVAEKDQLRSVIHERQLGKGHVLMNAQQEAADANAAAITANDAAGGTQVTSPDIIKPVVTTDVDAQGITADALRSMHPGEAGAHDYAKGIDSALSFIRTGGAR